MAAAYSTPLSVPLHYDPSFKVDVQLHQPLLSKAVTQAVMEIEVMSLCSQLEILCRKELSEQPSGRIEHGHVSNSFINKATVVHDRLQQLMSKNLADSCTLGQYIVSKKLDIIFPRAAAYIGNPQDFSLSDGKTGLDVYYQDLSALHNLSSVARQINSDLQNLADHKYIAHQTAILYQAVTNVGGTLLEPFKKSIEENFKAIKATLSQDHNGVRQLEPHQKEWFLSLTSGLVNTINSFPVELTTEMVQLAAVLKQS